MEHLIRQCPASTCGAMAATSSPEPPPQRRRPRHDESAGCVVHGRAGQTAFAGAARHGGALGRVLFVLVVPRRKIALRNLELCFPRPVEQRRSLGARELYRLLPDLAGPQLAVVGPSVGGGAARASSRALCTSWTAMCPPSSSRPTFTGWTQAGWYCRCALPGRSPPFFLPIPTRH
jgi:hypothetical protein